jgi:UDP-glucose:(heptosyl)LPS alpha-1,3-glucosyltransferase
MTDDVLSVALVLDRFDPERGGLEGWTAALAGWLQRAGHRVHVVAFAAAEPQPPGLAVHLLPPVAGRLERAAAVSAFLASRSFDIVHDTGVGWHYDLLHPQGGSREADWQQNQRSRRPAQRLVERWHPARQRRMTELRRLEQRQYREAAGIVVAVSRQVAADLTAHEGVAPERLRQIYNGIESAGFARDPRCGAEMRRRLGIGEATLFVQAAHNFRLKGVATTLRAVARLHQPASAVRLAVLGRDPDPACRRLAEALGISGQVTFAGFVADVRPYLWAADACLHPAFYDPCSLAALEALAAGLPLVTTQRNGVSELMTDGREGFVIADARDDAALAAAMLRLLAPEPRAVMAAAAARLGATWDCERNFRAVLALYREIMAARRAGRAAPRLG